MEEAHVPGTGERRRGFGGVVTGGEGSILVG
jgi:hypothetical protein